MICYVWGNTYPIKERLKKLGFRFEGNRWENIALNKKDRYLIENALKYEKGIKIKFFEPKEIT